jgi:hypothetical protein
MKKIFTFFAVAVMALAAQANELTVAEGDQTQSMLPIYGFYVDRVGTFDQMIYPESMLTDMAGGKINALKFYTDETGMKFADVTLQLALKTVTEDGFETAQAITGATVVAETTPAKGDLYLTFELVEPFEYAGDNLMVEVRVIATQGDWGSTKFYGIATENTASYCEYVWSNWGDPAIETYAFLPMATFTYEPASVTPPTPPTPTEETAAPTFNGYTTDGIHAYFVQINPTEPSTIYYRVQYPDGTWSEWAEYDDILSFTGNGKYRVEAYAVAPNKLPSTEIAYEFVVSPFTGISEMNADKAVAGVRYFNMAGQEMPQANGLTIVVTTYTDGTTSSVKVVK